MSVGSKQVSKNLDDWASRQRWKVIQLAKEWAGILEARARTNAPWRDQTVNARNGLFGSVFVSKNEVNIVLGYSVEYGIYLELANEGKYAILKPTLDAAAGEIMQSYRKLWE